MWRKAAHDCLTQLSHSDIITRASRHASVGREREIRYAALLQNQLMQISNALGKLQAAVNVCWHKLSKPTECGPFAIDLLKCLMAPTRLSVATLKHDLDECKREFHLYREAVYLKNLRLVRAFGRQRMVRAAKSWFHEFRWRHKCNWVQRYGVEVLLEKRTNFLNFFIVLKEWRFRTMISVYEFKIRELEVHLSEAKKWISNLNAQVAQLQGLSEDMARMMHERLMQKIMKKAFAAMHKNMFDKKISFLTNEAERFKLRNKGLEEENAEKKLRITELDASLTVELNKVQVLQKRLHFMYEKGILKYYRYDRKAFKGWKDHCIRSYRRKWVAAEANYKKSEKDAKQLNSTVAVLREKNEQLERKTMDQIKRIAELEAEKTEISEHFTEALRVAKGGKCLPAIPSSFLCRNCKDEIEVQAKDEAAQRNLEIMAKEGSERLKESLANFADAVGDLTKRKIGAKSRSPSPIMAGNIVLRRGGGQRVNLLVDEENANRKIGENNLNKSNIYDELNSPNKNDNVNTASTNPAASSNSTRRRGSSSNLGADDARSRSPLKHSPYNDKRSSPRSPNSPKFMSSNGYKNLQLGGMFSFGGHEGLFGGATSLKKGSNNSRNLRGEDTNDPNSSGMPLSSMFGLPANYDSKKELEPPGFDVPKSGSNNMAVDGNKSLEELRADAGNWGRGSKSKSKESSGSRTRT